jgi:hypothetical protein
MKKLLLFALAVLILQVSYTNAASYSENYSSTSTNKDTPQFFITTLKYEPYPVNAGDWFDVWVKAENLGREDATNAQFELVTPYPFESYDTVRQYGRIPGTDNANSIKQPDESMIEANQVIMKFRVRAADNAPYGTSLLKIRMKTDKDSDYSIDQDVPIEIEKTKTDFDVVMQESTDQGISFAIANIGENAATALTVSVPDQQGVVIRGPRSSIIGNLDKGDFTTASFLVSPEKNKGDILLQLAYTDIAGVRNTINKTVIVDSYSLSNSTITGFRRPTSNSSTVASKIIFLLLGAVIGIAGLVYFQKRKNK